MNRILLIAGCLLLLLGLLGFLASAVALANAQEVAEVKTPPGIELKHSPDDPRVQERRRQAEWTLFGSVLIAGIGIALLGTGWLRARRERRHLSS